MNYSEWKEWVLSLPWLLRWFVFVVLLRPVIDLFYFLKNISPFLSPLYLVGVLTPYLSALAVIKFRRPLRTREDVIFIAWSVLAGLSSVFVFVNDTVSLVSVGHVLKLTLPVYLFFFLRVFIRSERDLHGILKTFIYSCVFTAGIFLYELLFQPFVITYSRGVQRIQGGYADIMNYAIYICLGFLVSAYFYFQKGDREQGFKRIQTVLVAGVLCVLGLFSINHVTSFGIFFILLVLFLAYDMRMNAALAFILLGAIALSVFVLGAHDVDERMSKLLKKDIEVYQGVRDPSYLMHGRVGRWDDLLELFLDSPVISHFFGYPLTAKDFYGHILVYPHNDYLRIMFFTGITGLILYLLFLFAVYRRVRSYDMKTGFLLTGAMAVLLLYSVTTLPTLYPSMLYIVFSVFAFVILTPEERGDTGKEKDPCGVREKRESGGKNACPAPSRRQPRPLRLPEGLRNAGRKSRPGPLQK